MDKKKLLILIGGIIALVLVCVVLVGLINGYWPWQSGGGKSDYKNPDSETTAATDETTEPDSSENTGSDDDNADNGSGSADGSNGSTTATEEGDIRIEIDSDGNLVIPGTSGSSGNNSGSENNTGSSGSTTDPTQSSETTEPTEETESQKPTSSAGESKTELDFGDFFNP